MPTNTELVNAALRKGGGAKRINDVTDSVGSAGIAADVLASERDDLLRDGTWNFSVTRTQLAQLASNPVFGFARAFVMPNDCLRVISIHDNSTGNGAVRYKLEAVIQPDGTYLNACASDASAIYLRYARNVVDPNLMSASFRQVLILRLAKIFATSIAKSATLFAALKSEEEIALRRAKSIDGIEDYPEVLPEGSWAMSRNAYGRRGHNRWPNT